MTMGANAISMIEFIICVFDVNLSRYRLQMAGVDAARVLTPMIDIMAVWDFTRPASKRSSMCQTLVRHVFAAIYFAIPVPVD